MSNDAEKTVIRAAKKGDLKTLERLIEGDPSLIEARDRDGSTPLHCASWRGHPEAVAYLLDAGADINGHNENGHWGTTPLHAAAHGNQSKVAELLVERGADVQARNLNDRTPVEETAIHNARAVVKVLQQVEESRATTL